MKNEIKELLREAYNSNDVCSEWKDKIKSVYPKVEVKHRSEAWLKDDGFPNWLMFFDSDGYCYGFNGAGDWIGKHKTHNNIYKNPKNRVATEEEIKQALINEAEKRGFKKGVEVEDVDGDVGFITGIHFNFNGDSSFGIWSNCNNFHIFNKKAKWAKTIETITKEEAEKQLGKTII